MSINLFKQYCKDNNLDFEVFQEKGSTHTAQDSADAYGIGINRIVKSLLVRINGEFVMFLVPGDKRLDFKDLEKRFETKKVRMASAEEVKDVTGYSIGGVSPFGHKTKLKTYVESGFPSDSPLLAAAGKEDAVFWVTLKELEEIVK
jgi:Cys-tRNA(Pro) deacylase